MGYLFKNCYMPFKDMTNDIYVRDGYIQEIGNNLKYPSAKIIDVKGKITFNGFVDSHMHLDKALIGENVFNKSGTLKEAIDIMGKYKKNMTEKDIKDRARAALEFAYKHGTRYIRTHIDVDDTIEFKGMTALLELREEFEGMIEIQIVAFPQEGFIENELNFKYLEKALELGADIVGGIPATEIDPKKHIDMIFELAKNYNKDIDMHIDETDDPDSLTIEYLAKKTILEHYQGRVVAAHCCSLSANELENIIDIIDLIREAKINIITLPSTNLYLQGRHDSKDYRRGITRVKDLLANDINVNIASDNIRDPFNPFGNANLLEVALIAAHGTYMGGIEDLNKTFDMISIIPSKLFENYEIEKGQKSKFIVIDSEEKFKAVINQSKIIGQFNEEEFQWNF